jgi:hypothetical protein
MQALDRTRGELKKLQQPWIPGSVGITFADFFEEFHGANNFLRRR